MVTTLVLKYNLKIQEITIASLVPFQLIYFKAFWEEDSRMNINRTFPGDPQLIMVNRRRLAWVENF